MTPIRRLSCSLALLGILAGACAKTSDEQLFSRAEDLYRSQKYTSAVPLFKEYLLRHPYHSGAHLYLGSCYALGSQWMSPAEGELHIALELYNRDGRRSTIPRFPDAYFEQRCYFELMRIAQMRVAALLDMGGSPDLFKTYLNQFKQAVANAKKVAPDDEAVKHAEEVLAQIEQAGPPQPQDQQDRRRRGGRYI